MPTIDRYSPGRLLTRRLGLLGVVAALLPSLSSLYILTGGVTTLIAHARVGKTSESLAPSSPSGGIEPAPARSSSGGGRVYFPPRTSTSLFRYAFRAVVINPSGRGFHVNASW